MSTMPQNNNKALPHIDAGDHNLVRVTEAAWQAVKAANNPPFMFRYGDFLAQIDFDTEGDRVVRRLGQDGVRHFLAQVAWWFKIKLGVAVDALPPLHVVRDFLVAPDGALPVLTRIVKAPVFASDGSLHFNAGYNAASRCFYAPAKGLQIPVVSPQPSPSDVTTALTLITKELLGDFPFVGDAERAHAVALLLLPFARDLIAGATPLHLIEKPTPGTGATLLADMLTYPFLGGPIPAMTEGNDDAEWRKRITAKLMGGGSVILTFARLIRSFSRADGSLVGRSHSRSERYCEHSHASRVDCNWK